MTHLPLSVVSCPSLTWRPSESHCQASLRTLWPSSLRSKWAGEDRARNSRSLWNLFGHSRSRVTDRLADQLVRGISPLSHVKGQHMKFVLVNGRTPNPPSFCALCCESIGESYLRELTTRLSYCDHECYLDHCKIAVKALQERARAS